MSIFGYEIFCISVNLIYCDRNFYISYIFKSSK